MKIAMKAADTPPATGSVTTQAVKIPPNNPQLTFRVR